jgi:hypothetical protein
MFINVSEARKLPIKILLLVHTYFISFPYSFSKMREDSDRSYIDKYILQILNSFEGPTVFYSPYGWLGRIATESEVVFS